MPARPKPPTPADVIEVAARLSGCPVAAIVGASRKQPVVHVRHVAMYVARQTTVASFPQIARAFGRDHTTVMHACSKVARQINVDSQVREHVASLMVEVAVVGPSHAEGGSEVLDSSATGPERPLRR